MKKEHTRTGLLYVPKMKDMNVLSIFYVDAYVYICEAACAMHPV